jgi:hypothetical protein
MKTKKVMRERNEHGPRHVTPAGRSVFYDLFPKAEADELVMRSTLLRGLGQWLKESGLTQTQAASCWASPKHAYPISSAVSLGSSA